MEAWWLSVNAVVLVGRLIMSADSITRFAASRASTTTEAYNPKNQERKLRQITKSNHAFVPKFLVENKTWTTQTTFVSHLSHSKNFKQLMLSATSVILQSVTTNVRSFVLYIGVLSNPVFRTKFFFLPLKLIISSRLLPSTPLLWNNLLLSLPFCFYGII